MIIRHIKYFLDRYEGKLVLFKAFKCKNTLRRFPNYWSITNHLRLNIYNCIHHYYYHCHHHIIQLIRLTFHLHIQLNRHYVLHIDILNIRHKYHQDSQYRIHHIEIYIHSIHHFLIHSYHHILHFPQLNHLHKKGYINYFEWSILNDCILYIFLYHTLYIIIHINMNINNIHHI